MRRICVLGCSGAGKSVLAKRLSELTSLPLIDLDVHYWGEGWTPPPPGEWRETHDALARGAHWIIDGNYTGTMERRLAMADTTIYLDMPRYLCLARVVLRTIRWWRRERLGAPAGCRERFDREFISYIWNYRRVHHPRVLEILAAHASTCTIVMIRSRRDTEAFIRDLSGEGGGPS